MIHVHLGLYGTFDVHDLVADVPPPVGEVRLRLVRIDGKAYADLRGATTCALVTGAERDAGRRPRSVRTRSGPTPTRRRPGTRIRRSAAPIGTLLMDQTVVAGVGNVYRAELLFRHRIHPLRPGRTLRVGQWQAMWDDLVVLMTEGVRTGTIDTVRPEHEPEAMGRPPRDDDHGGEVYVYRRTGQPCHVCGRPVSTTVLGARNLLLVQPLPAGVPIPGEGVVRRRAGRWLTTENLVALGLVAVSAAILGGVALMPERFPFTALNVPLVVGALVLRQRTLIWFVPFMIATVATAGALQPEYTPAHHRRDRDPARDLHLRPGAQPATERARDRRPAGRVDARRPPRPDPGAGDDPESARQLAGRVGHVVGRRIAVRR